MSIVEKLHCDACQRDDSLSLNHVWTVRAIDDKLIITPGLDRSQPDARHVCSPDCLSKTVARWAADPTSFPSLEKEQPSL